MPVSYPYIQYSGIWTTSQATDAVAAGTWAVPPAPHLLSWGYNGNGNLGLGNTTYYSSPKQVGSLTNWSSLSSNRAAGGAIKSDGTLWKWGYNNYGQLGLGNTTQYSSPKQVGSLTNWLITAGGNYHTLAIKTDGTLWAWGRNSYGQLGTNNLTNVSSPVQVGTLTDWLRVSGGAYHSAAIKVDGTLWAWGYNFVGAVGIGTSGNYISSPVQVGSGTTWSNVVIDHSYSTIATKTDGTLWAWGGNNNGQLGLGNTTDYSSPKQVGSLTTWLNVSSGGYATGGIKTDGTLWSWGYGNFGTLGLGNTTSYSSPKQVGILTNWASIYTTPGYDMYSIKTDGTLWAWGGNFSGSLGLGNTTQYNSPKQVGSLKTWITLSPMISSTLAIAKT